MIRYEDSTAKAAGDATDDVNDTYPQPTEQFLQISHKQQLKDDAEQQLQNTAYHTHTHTQSNVT